MLSPETGFAGEFSPMNFTDYFDDTASEELLTSASASTISSTMASPLPSVDEVPSSASQSPKMSSSELVDMQQLHAAQAAIAAMAYQQTLNIFGVANPLVAPASLFDHSFSSLTLLPGYAAMPGVSLVNSVLASPSLSPVGSVASIGSPLSLFGDMPLAPDFSQSSSLASTPGMTSTATTRPASPAPFSASDLESATAQPSAAHGKASTQKKKRRPKPRMHELPTNLAEAKRTANRESARKCRERKRQREQCVVGEKEKLTNEIQRLRLALAAERSKTELLEKLLTEYQAQPLFSVV